MAQAQIGQKSLEINSPLQPLHNPKTLPLHNPTIQPVLSAQIGKDLEAYIEAMERIKLREEEVKKLAAMLQTMKNPMMGVQEVMAAIMGVQGSQIAGLSAVDNLDSDLRSAVGTGQSSFNGMENGDKTEISQAKKLIKILDGLENFLKYEKSLGKNSVFGQGGINNLQDAINSIKQTFGSAWGNPASMAADIKGWVANETKDGKYSPELKTIGDAFQTLNQSTSALSTTTNTQLQFKTQQFKQTMGMDESSMQAYLKSLSAMVNNQKSN